MLSMTHYGKNSVGAATRLMLMCAFTDRKSGNITARKRELIESYLKGEGQDPKQFLTKIVKDYDRDRIEASKGKQFLFGDAVFPRALVTTAFSEFTEVMEQLNMAQLLHAMATLGREEPTQADILLIQSAVGSWKIDEQWGLWLTGQAVPDALQGSVSAPKSASKSYSFNVTA